MSRRRPETRGATAGRGERRERERRLRAALLAEPVPEADAAERRGEELVRAAFAEREAARVDFFTPGVKKSPRRRWSAPLPRLAAALALASVVVVAVLSPAGAGVREWVDDVFDGGVPEASRGLGEIPGGGRLLVGSPSGPWVVQPDGSRRLLGDYREAGWSPRGLFVAVAEGDTLSAVEPDGTPRWSLDAAGPVSNPRWAPSGLQIAYRSGGALRVVDADGDEDRALAGAVAPVAPAWAPTVLPLLAYVGADGALTLASAESGEALGSAAALDGVEALRFSPRGETLLEASPGALRLREVGVSKALAGLRLSPGRLVAAPAGARIAAAEFAPDGSSIAVLLVHGGAGPGAADGAAGPDGAAPPDGAGNAAARSEVALLRPDGERWRRLFALSGRLEGLAFSPDGSRLLVGWPAADQWLFLPTAGRSRPRAVGGIAAEFSPGATSAAAFPTVLGWCCQRPLHPTG